MVSLREVIMEQDLIDLIKTQTAKEKEDACLEFKVNNTNPEEIGIHISALSNEAALAQKRLFLYDLGYKR